MRYIFPVILMLTVVGYSCNSDSKAHPNRLDTIPKALFKQKVANGTVIGPYLDTVIYQYVSRYVFKDTPTSSGGHWITDTFAYGRIPDDTLRDAQRHAIFDSAHHPKIHYSFYLLNKDSVLRTQFH
jgi:hypothetical protein